MRRACFCAAAVALFLISACADRRDEAADGKTSGAQAGESQYNVTLWPEIETPDLTNAETEARIDALLASMTLEQKVGQIIQADSSSVTPEEVRQYRLGSVLSGGNSAPGGKAYATADEWLAMADAFYDASVDPEGVETAIPILLGIDAVHGHNNVIGGTVFPHNIGLGAARDPDLVRRIAEATAKELRVTGHDWTFAPTVAVPQDDRWGRTYEGFSEDPDIVASYAGVIVEGLQGELDSEAFMGPDKVVSTAKHYLGDGGTEGGRDQGDAQASEADLARIHGAGYPPAIRAGALSVMASFSSWKGEALHAHRYLLTDVLKDRMGFDGFVVGDWNGHAKVEGCTNEDCPAAVNAGLDMFMAPDSWKGLYENTLNEARAGEISEARLDDAVRRILRAKLRFGVFEQGRPSGRPLSGDETVLGAPEHKALAREAVRKSLVLLKNNEGVLPLRRDLKVLVAGDGADDISKQSGGWTLTWQGGGLDKALFPNGESVFDGLKAAVESGGGQIALSENGAYDEKPDVAIVVFGEDSYAEFQGDLDNVAFNDPSGEALAIMRKLKADGVPVISVFLSGRPLWVNPELNASDAFVAAWLPGTAGGGVADVLFRDSDGAVNYDFTGRLSYSWPKNAAQTPLNKGDEGYDPLFALGYGLTYEDDGSLPALSEDSGLDESDKGTPGVYFAGGEFAPSIKLMTGADVSSLSEDGGAVSVRRVDHQAQEDAIELSFPESGGAAALASGEAIDLSRETVGQLELSFAFRAEMFGEGAMDIGVLCGEGCAGMIDLGDVLREGEGAGWRRMRVTLACFADAGADMSRLSAPFAIETHGAARIAIADVHLVQDANGVKDCGLVEAN
ncbi:glycoside hydrolase family 3 protein [Hyphococcus luteus]|nr:glycoside hydrolase family 3 protein [Marinicaulis flavus]